LRANASERRLMTYITIAVTAAVIVYLFAALVRPEWF
jgi:F subunit of K+-transporting ATPase (Potass_KdpF)